MVEVYHEGKGFHVDHFEICLEGVSTVGRVDAAEVTLLPTADVVVVAALFDAVAVEGHQVESTTIQVALHAFEVLVVGALRVATVVVGVVPHIAGTPKHTVLVEVNVTLETSFTHVLSRTLPARSNALLAGCPLVGIGSVGTDLQTSVVVEVGSDAFEAVSAVETVSAKFRALAALVSGALRIV